MAKPKRERPTTNELGKKINQVLQAKGQPGDYASIAKFFEVAVPSVYDWVDHGRIAKHRLPKLVEWSGHPLDWWFQGEDASTPTHILTHHHEHKVQEDCTPYHRDDSIHRAMRTLGHRLTGASPETQEQATTLLSQLVKYPHSHEMFAEMLEVVLKNGTHDKRHAA